MISLVAIFLQILPIDKIYHFGAGVTISWTIGQKKPIYGVYGGHTAGILKEIRDIKKTNKADYKDALATTSGGFFTFIVWLTPKRIHVKRD